MKTYPKRLYKSTDNKVISGVIGGIGEYFDIDPVVFRALYVAFSFFAGILPGVLAYIIMAIIIPRHPVIIHEKAEVKEEK